MNHQAQKIKDLLATIPEFVGTNGKLLMSNIRAAAKSYDDTLISTLLSDDTSKEMFFRSVGGATLFDIDKFLWVINCQEFLKGSFTAYKQKIGLVDSNGDFITNNGDVVLSFPHKDCVLEFDSTDETASANSEVMLNEIIAKEDIDVLLDEKAFANVKKVDADGETEITVFEDDADGILIKGNNLLALYSLVPRYENKIKLMYWDVLYNTDNDQVPYNDSFKHDTWLVMMKNRLEVAKTLLRQDGVICLQCDDNEQAYLTVLCDEILGRNNRINTVSIKTKTSSGASGGGEDKRLKKNIEYILIYAKNRNCFSLSMPSEETNLMNVIQNKRNEGKSFEYSRVLVSPGEREYITKTKDGQGNDILIYSYKNAIIKSIKELMNEEKLSEEEIYIKYFNHIFRTTNAQTSIRTRVNDTVGKTPYVISIEYKPKTGKNKGNTVENFYLNGDLFCWLSDTAILSSNRIIKSEKLGTLWDDIPLTGIKKEGNVDLKNGKKPEKLLERIISMFTSEGDIVLDAYLGSGTTAAVAHKMGRKYIGIEQLDKHMAMSIQRVTDVIHGEESGISKIVHWQGGGAFITFDLADNSKRVINDIKDAETPKELSYILKELKDSPFVLARVDIEKLGDDDWNQLSFDEQKALLLSVVDLNTLYVNLTEIDDETSGIAEGDKSFTKSFYNVQED